MLLFIFGGYLTTAVTSVEEARRAHRRHANGNRNGEELQGTAAITGFAASPLRRIAGSYFTLQATRGSVMEEVQGGHFAICAWLSFICGRRQKPPSIRDFSSRRSHCDRSAPLRSEFLL